MEERWFGKAFQIFEAVEGVVVKFWDAISSDDMFDIDRSSGNTSAWLTEVKSESIDYEVDPDQKV